MTEALSERLTRILTMVPYVQRHPGIELQELADYLGCDPETIVADLNAILLCGVPPYLPNDYIGVVIENDRIFISFADYFKRPVNLTLEEALSLSLALRQLPLDRAGLESAQKLRKKIAGLLPGAMRAQWKEARRQVEISPLSRPLQDRIALLRQAVAEHREVHMEYYTASRDEMTQRDVQPFGLIEHNGEWYLIGQCSLRDQQRPFRVDRIRSLQLLDRTFTPPKSFDLDRYRRPQMYFPSSRDLRVKLRIAPELARWVAEELPGGKLRALSDGGVVLHLSVSQPQWVVFWTLAHATQVEIQAPDVVRKKVAEACRKTLERYR